MLDFVFEAISLNHLYFQLGNGGHISPEDFVQILYKINFDLFGNTLHKMQFSKKERKLVGKIQTIPETRFSEHGCQATFVSLN